MSHGFPHIYQYQTDAVLNPQHTFKLEIKRISGGRGDSINPLKNNTESKCQSHRQASAGKYETSSKSFTPKKPALPRLHESQKKKQEAAAIVYCTLYYTIPVSLKNYLVEIKREKKDEEHVIGGRTTARRPPNSRRSGGEGTSRTAASSLGGLAGGLLVGDGGGLEERTPQKTTRRGEVRRLPP